MISQIELVVGILKLLGLKDDAPLIPRQFNAVINAANEILSEFERPIVMASPGMGLAAWRSCDDTGLSSKYMYWAIGCHVEKSGPMPGQNVDWPRDSGDFGRCVRFLDADPIKLRPRLETMKGHGKQWAALVDNWPELERLYYEKSDKLCGRVMEVVSC